MVDIVFLTYNHIDYIEQSLKSIQSQDLFSTGQLTLWIGDDSSTDGTSKVCENFAKRFEFVHHIRHEKNIGAMNNLSYLLQKCTGKYVAFLEGDDYWIRNDKLSLQVQILQDSANISLVFTNALMHYCKGYGFDRLYVPTKLRRRIILKDIIKEQTFAHTSTLMIRRVSIERYLSSLSSIVVGDIPLTIWSLLNGHVGEFLPITSSVYRKHDGGMVRELLNSYIETRQNLIIFYASIQEDTYYVKRKIFALNLDILEYSIRHKMNPEINRYLLQTIKYLPYVNARLLLKLILTVRHVF